MAGLWCAGLGFSERRLADAAHKQMLELPYYHTFFGKAHEPAIELAERLLSLAPPGTGLIEEIRFLRLYRRGAPGDSGGHQVMVANRHVPRALLSTDRRLYQALDHLNRTTNDLPRRM